MTRHGDHQSVLGVILAGGRSRRFDAEDKAFSLLAGKPMIQHVIDRAAPQVAGFVISSNAAPAPFSGLGAWAVVADATPRFQGPLAGLAAAIAWLSDRNPGIGWIATFPVDGPFLPTDMVEVLLEQALELVVPAVASSRGRIHPVFGVWPASIATALKHYLARERRESLIEFVASQRGIFVEFAAREPDPFFNVNTRADQERAETLIKEMCRSAKGR
jgi:molybdopterin-guanine dinucleotide biosynthesis protein A